MAQNISLQGATYSGVPAVILPKSGGGTASFTDVSDTTASASDVASGKYFYTAAGVRTEGTASGGAGTVTITDTLDAAGGTIREITTNPITLDTLNATADGTYNAPSGHAYNTVNVSVGGGGLTTITSGTFTGNNNGDSTAGVGRQLINIGTKMAQTDFWVFLHVANGEEFEYSSTRQYVWLAFVVRHELGSYDLSTTGSKSFTSSYSVDSNNSGTITTRTAGDAFRSGKQMYNGSISDTNNFNYYQIKRETDHFEIWIGTSNPAYAFPAKTYTYEIVYFGSNPSADIVEIE